MNTEYIITCPECGKAMEKVMYKSVMVDRCTTCNSMWFDRMEKEQLRERLGSEKIDEKAPTAQKREKVVTRTLHCPVCIAMPLKSTRDQRQTHLVYKRCPQCHGSYMKAGQFADYKDEAFKDFHDRLL